jgi:plastocyanin
LVSRLLSPARVLGAAVAVLALLVAPAAHANNTRVSITNYAWSNPAVHLNLGEKVTWDWLGPDLAHSVTGISPNATGWDSDPHTDAPDHQPGDSFTIQFNTPGTYLFQCKLHAFVRGEVIVSETPGDPNSDPGPQPPLNIDVVPPTLGAITVHHPNTRRGKGVGMTANINEKGALDAEYYLLLPGGRRTYAGFKTWSTFIGINRFALGARWKRFKAKPGRYEAVLRATDQSNNSSKPRKTRFTIYG